METRIRVNPPYEEVSELDAYRQQTDYRLDGLESAVYGIKRRVSTNEQDERTRRAKWGKRAVETDNLIRLSMLLAGMAICCSVATLTVLAVSLWAGA